MSLRSRLAAVERQLAPLGETPLVIVIRGGLHANDPMHATAGEHRWERAPDESLAAFKARALAEAIAAGEEFLVIAGLLN